MITEEELEAATRRGLDARRTQPRALAVRYNVAAHRVEVDLNTGYTVLFPPERAQDLCHASDEALCEPEVSGVGFGIYFPRLDADLWVPSIAQGRFGSDRWEAEWREAHPLEDNPPVQAVRTEAA